MNNGLSRKPKWLKTKIRTGGGTRETREILRELCLSTVCEEAGCPNRMECFCRGSAAFLILGDRCTRNCAFCLVKKEPPRPPDALEPARVGTAVQRLGLSHAVVTSVTRDDLPDGGADHFAETVREIREKAPGVSVEVLIPDFGGNPDALERVIRARPDVINHNMETVRRLYGEIRPGADYMRSLRLLAAVSRTVPPIPVKSGFMVGFGETEEEVLTLMGDLRSAGCSLLTVGQYLAPSGAHRPVTEYVEPEVFERYRMNALSMGFLHAACAPLVRSSYRAEEASLLCRKDRRMKP